MEEEKEVEEKETKENGEVEKENGKEESNGDSTPAEGDKCCVKRKSMGTGGDAPEEMPAEGATPRRRRNWTSPQRQSPTGKQRWPPELPGTSTRCRARATRLCRKRTYP